MELKNKKIKVTPEIARIHAHVCGDGSVYIRNSKRGPSELARHKRRNIYRKEWTIEYYNNELDLVKEFINDFKVAFNRNKKTIKNKMRYRGVKHIAEKLELIGKNSYSWYIPEFIMNSSKNIMCNWIRAFFDDEAYIFPSRKRILVKSMNKKGLQQIVKLLSKLEISSKVTGPNCDNSYYLVVYRKGLLRYQKNIGFLMQRKSDLLNHLVEENGAGGTFKAKF